MEAVVAVVAVAVAVVAVVVAVVVAAAVESTFAAEPTNRSAGQSWPPPVGCLPRVGLAIRPASDPFEFRIAKLVCEKKLETTSFFWP